MVAGWGRGDPQPRDIVGCGKGDLQSIAIKARSRQLGHCTNNEYLSSLFAFLVPRTSCRFDGQFLYSSFAISEYFSIA